MDINISNLAMQFGSHNTHDLFDWVTGVLTSIAPLVAIWVSWLLAKKEIRNSESHFNKQLELQRLQWKNYSFFKYKQDKLLELRTQFLTFKKDTITFLQTFLPDKPIMPPLGSADSTIKYEYTTIFLKQNPNKIIKQNLDNCKELYSLLENNDIFFNENYLYYEYLISIVRDLKELYNELLNNNLFETLFVKHGDKYIAKPQNELFRIYIFKFFQYRLRIKIKDESTNIFYKNSNSPFKTMNLSFDNDKIKEWVMNEQVLLFAWNAFTEHLLDLNNFIDNYFKESISDIEKIKKIEANTDIEETEFYSLYSLIKTISIKIIMFILPINIQRQIISYWNKKGNYDAK